MLMRLPGEVGDASEEGQLVAHSTDVKSKHTSQGSGGTIGLTMKGAALALWFLARPVTAVHSSNFENVSPEEEGQ